MSHSLAAEITECIDRSAQRGKRSTRLLPAGSRELPLGAHVVTPRGAYLHHGIYVGSGVVVHYGGLGRGLRTGPVEAVSIEQFTQRRPLRVLLDSSPYFSSAEIVQRALSRVGEDRYHVLKNNCEHFCEWCVRAEQRSYQVDRWLSWPLRALEGTSDFVAQLFDLFGRLVSYIHGDIHSRESTQLRCADSAQDPRHAQRKAKAPSVYSISGGSRTAH